MAKVELQTKDTSDDTVKEKDRAVKDILSDYKKEISDLKGEVKRRDEHIEKIEKNLVEYRQFISRLVRENRVYRSNFQNTSNQLIEFSAGILRSCVDTPDSTKDDKILNIIREQ
jgi:chromosome segregation ATPase